MNSADYSPSGRRAGIRRCGSIVAVATLVVGLFSVSVAHADTITATWFEQGWFKSTGEHTHSNTHTYLVGNISGTTYRNFFVFNLAGITDHIISAQLRVFNPSNGYASGDATETWTLYDVSASSMPLVATTASNSSVDVYNDLGSGNVYGSRTLSPADNNTDVYVDLNTAAFITHVNAARGQMFAIGGALTTLDSNLSTGEYFGANSSYKYASLILTMGPEVPSVPLPSSLWGSIVLLASLAMVKRCGPAKHSA